MLKGRVNSHGEPIVFLSLLLRGRPVRSPVVIDTGFNGYLSVPRRLAERGGWRYLGTEDFEIATGQSVEEPVYLGQIIFDQVPLTVYAVATEPTTSSLGLGCLRTTS